jgi:hypothetical protein
MMRPVFTGVDNGKSIIIVQTKCRGFPAGREPNVEPENYLLCRQVPFVPLSTLSVVRFTFLRQLRSQYKDEHASVAVQRRLKQPTSMTTRTQEVEQNSSNYSVLV